MIQSKKPQIMLFYANWCGPCKAYKTVFEKAVAEYEPYLGEVTYHDIDEADEEFLQRWKVIGIPTTVMSTAQHKETGRIVGYNKYDTLMSFIRREVL